MTSPTYKSDHGLVVDDIETNMRYAVSDRNFNPDIHEKVRELGPGESVLSYTPRRRRPLGDPAAETSGAGTPETAGEPETDSGDSL